jgi:hypothetical protein
MANPLLSICPVNLLRRRHPLKAIVQPKMPITRERGGQYGRTSSLVCATLNEVTLNTLLVDEESQTPEILQ